eukprot:GHUV01040860.1.p2 GENE.GHUV01040860.1~~GHUV01040860.1.p2  ORF type:complete len:157 (-),score=7.76 GHUV01040860.1:542-1012(-)
MQSPVASVWCIGASRVVDDVDAIGDSLVDCRSYVRERTDQLRPPKNLVYSYSCSRCHATCDAQGLHRPKVPSCYTCSVISVANYVPAHGGWMTVQTPAEEDSPALSRTWIRSRVYAAGVLVLQDICADVLLACLLSWLVTCLSYPQQHHGPSLNAT